MSTGPSRIEPRITPREFAEIRRRGVVRRRRLVALAVVGLLVAGYFAWKVNRHLFAAGWLGASSIRADWQVDRETWTVGGVTAVRAVVNNFSYIARREARDLSPIASLHRVESLDLSNLPELVDADLESLPDLADLQTLNLDQTSERFGPPATGSGLTDATLARLRGLRRLRELSLARARITDAGLADLSGLADLESLNLGQTAITDAGLEPLKGLKRLKWLTLTGTKVTDPGVRAFEAARPDVTVTANPPPPRPPTPTPTQPMGTPRP